MTVKELVECCRTKDRMNLEIRENNNFMFSTNTQKGNDFIKCIYDRKVKEWLVIFDTLYTLVIDLVPLESDN